jgi:hypothetical protein
MVFVFLLGICLTFFYVRLLLLLYPFAVNILCKPIDIVTYRPITRQRLGKHIPVGANAGNKTSIAGQHMSKIA